MAPMHPSTCSDLALSRMLLILFDMCCIHCSRVLVLLKMCSSVLVARFCALASSFFSNWRRAWSLRAPGRVRGSDGMTHLPETYIRARAARPASHPLTPVLSQLHAHMLPFGGGEIVWRHFAGLQNCSKVPRSAQVIGEASDDSDIHKAPHFVTFLYTVYTLFALFHEQGRARTSYLSILWTRCRDAVLPPRRPTLYRSGPPGHQTQAGSSMPVK
jgi:hypothetical protein